MNFRPLPLPVRAPIWKTLTLHFHIKLGIYLILIYFFFLQYFSNCVSKICDFHSCFRCKICSTVISNKSSCSRHFKVHSGEKSYVCPICNKAFYRQDYLQRHLKTHGNSTGSELESLVKLAMNGVKKQWRFIDFLLNVTSCVFFL